MIFSSRVTLTNYLATIFFGMISCFTEQEAMMVGVPNSSCANYWSHGVEGRTKIDQ